MTKGTPILMTLVLATALAAGPAFAGGDAASPGFERLKSLVGTWEGKGPDGSPATVTYRLVSNGTALMEELSVEGMVTVYYPDGTDVMLTHYCSGNNQPRMRAGGLQDGGKSLRFAFQDITNLSDPKDGHMSDLTVTFLDGDHFRQEWTSTKDGEKQTASAEWTRVK